MAALLLAGLTLMTGVPWVTMMDWIGRATLWVLDMAGWLALTPLRWMMGSTSGARRQRAVDADREDDELDSGETMNSPNPVAESVTETAVQRTERSLAARWMEQSRETLMGWVDVVAEKSRAWQRRRRLGTDIGDLLDAAVAPPGDANDPSKLTIKPAALQSPVASAERGSIAGEGRHSARIEPMFNLPSEAVVQPPEETIGDRSVSDLTLVPVLPTHSSSANASLLPLTASCEEQDEIVPPPQPVSRNRSKEAVADVPATPVTPAEPVSLTQSRTVAPVTTTARRVAPPRPSIPVALPPLELLDSPPLRTTGYGSDLLDEMSHRLESLFKSFGIAVQVVAVEPGPIITRFEIEPAPGIKVNQISNLVKDLARGLSVTSVRVVEIIPGKSVIGLEIPNRKREIVHLRETLESLAYAQSTAPLTLALGKDIGGNPVVANLNKMPHLLVAGTTGSGKSVAINAMLLSLLYKSPPRDVRLILVDPKALELSMYEDIPHLLMPVVADMKEAVNALRWCVAEMERRYRLMAALKVRNIAGFNRKVLDALDAGEGLADPFWNPDNAGIPGEITVLQPLPFIVVVIDELADMMMIVGKQVEELIARLAQKARAAGIHLILATQRPSVDVITGLIKANIPTRIAFQVSSRVDSRTILDQMGAEQLLGHGDMLYLPPGAGLPQRVHGAFVDDHEVNRVVEYLRQTGAPDYLDEVLAEPQG
ncbi:MAG: hypothetical protein KDJ28_13195 [Candidatus Competibacteraceae bacterium]|nr:hypothetical protein [Candidatus Competibacteraceae bacterium]